MTKKILMLPTPTQAAQNNTNSIHNIVISLQKHLPAYGYELTENAAEADLIAGHAGQTYGQGDKLDVCHCHGLYPTAQFPEIEWHFEANAAVIKNIKSARAVTVPSQWVADIFRRDMHLDPDVVGWAIEPDEWLPPDQHKGYVLWNKTRPDKVCDPAPALDLARRFANQDFITTFGEGGANVRTVGLQPYANMREIVRHAEIGLCTTKETWGIGTVEMAASGVPILGYAWGGTADLITHGIDGYLVEPGDLDGLAEGLLYCKKHRDILGANARKMALTHTWDKVAAQFATIYDRVWEQNQDTRPYHIEPSLYMV